SSAVSSLSLGGGPIGFLHLGSVTNAAVMLMNFPDDLSKPFTVAATRDAMFTGTQSAWAHLTEVSGGKIVLRGDVFDWTTMPAPNTTTACNTTSWATAADNALKARG